MLREGRLERDCSLAAIKKMDYIIKSINRIGKAVQIISIARNKKNSQKCTVHRCIADNKENELLLAPAVGSKKKLLSYLGEIQANVWLFFWLLRYVEKNEKILVYHSQRYMLPIWFAAKIRKFEYILEVEELYYKFGFVSERFAKIEKQFIMDACSLIASTDNIRVELEYHKKVVLLHGNYQNLSNDAVHNLGEHKIVFAGGIENVRNTAFNVCDCAEFLDECFKIYILGYGDEQCICQLQQKIEIINSKIGRECIVYCGTKIGAEYDSFMQESSIAINFQNMDEYYMKFAFPSKVLNYLNYGLIVITTPLETIRKSEIDRLVFYPHNMENTPQAFANKINQLKAELTTSKQKIVETMNQLDSKFVFELEKII